MIRLRSTLAALACLFALTEIPAQATAQTPSQTPAQIPAQATAQTPGVAVQPAPGSSSAQALARNHALDAVELSPLPAGPTLRKVRAAQALNCGVNFEEVEYSTEDAHGNHSLFDLDVCKAIAVAVLGPGAKTIVVPYRDERDALKGLKLGEIDVLATGSPNLVNTASGFGFSRPVFYDFQGFLVNKALGIHSAKDLAGKKTCYIDGFEIANQIAGYMPRESIKWMPFPFQEEGEMEAAFLTRNCAAVTADVSQLAYERIAFKSLAAQFEILPDVVATDPLAITYRLDDPQWALVLDWVPNALIQAEQSGVTQSNLAAMKSSSDPVIQRLLGTQKGWGQFLSLDDAWAARAVEAVGNYGELYERTLGSGSLMHLARGANNLSTNGGLMLADPMR
jgi:general L-amino acid transport system substrate-binding protein